MGMDQIPHNFGNDARTLLTETARGRFEISDTLQRKTGSRAATAVLTKRG